MITRCSSAGDRMLPVSKDTEDVSKGDDHFRIQVALVFSAFFMALWVFASPGSLWVGSSEQHDALGREAFKNSGGELIAPASLVYKYSIIGQAAGWTHALPGAVWCLLAPLQLSSAARKAEDGAVHRWGGRLMLAAASVLMVGYAIIDQNNIHAEVVDFAGCGGGVARAFAELDSRLLGGILPPLNVSLQRAVAAWFVFTGAQVALTGARGPRDVREHRRWALRHIAAGVWVAAQRAIFLAARALQVALSGAGAAAAPEAMGDAFYYSEYLAVAACVLAAEREADACSRGKRGLE